MSCVQKGIKLRKKQLNNFVVEPTVESTFDKMMKNKKRKAAFDKGYKELLLSEMLFAAMEQDVDSVCELAKAAGVSLVIIKKLKSGERKNITMAMYSEMLCSVGYELAIEPIKKNFFKKSK